MSKAAVESDPVYLTPVSASLTIGHCEDTAWARPVFAHWERGARGPDNKPKQNTKHISACRVRARAVRDNQQTTPLGHRLDTAWAPLGHRLDTTWTLLEHLQYGLDSAWTPLGPRRDTAWTPLGRHLDSA